MGNYFGFMALGSVRLGYLLWVTAGGRHHHESLFFTPWYCGGADGGYP